MVDLFLFENNKSSYENLDIITIYIYATIKIARNWHTFYSPFALSIWIINAKVNFYCFIHV
jgi:hypothetical protein